MPSVAQVATVGRRKIPGLLLAAAAEEHGLTVLRDDADFDLVAAATSQSTLWVVPVGTVD